MLEILRKRRSIRKYINTVIEAEKIDELVKSALLSPSSRNIQPCEYIVVTDRNILEKLSHAKEHGSSFLKNASLGMVVLADSDRSDAWIEDSSISSIIIQLTAESIGLASCWIQIRGRMRDTGETAEQYVRSILNIPENRKVESIISIGYQDEEKRPYTDEELNFNRVFKNEYSRKYS